MSHAFFSSSHPHDAPAGAADAKASSAPVPQNRKSGYSILLHGDGDTPSVRNIMTLFGGIQEMKTHGMGHGGFRAENFSIQIFWTAALTRLPSVTPDLYARAQCILICPKNAHDCEDQIRKYNRAFEDYPTRARPNLKVVSNDPAPVVAAPPVPPNPTRCVVM
jgi:hypothetical protein